MQHDRPAESFCRSLRNRADLTDSLLSVHASTGGSLDRVRGFNGNAARVAIRIDSPIRFRRIDENQLDLLKSRGISDSQYRTALLDSAPSLFR